VTDQGHSAISSICIAQIQKTEEPIEKSEDHKCSGDRSALSNVTRIDRL
jgi:hypothetical protein